MPELTPKLPVIHYTRCTGCGDCAAACPSGALGISVGAPFFKDPQACTFCGLCELICPVGAVELPYELSFNGGLS